MIQFLRSSCHSPHLTTTTRVFLSKEIIVFLIYALTLIRISSTPLSLPIFHGVHYCITSYSNFLLLYHSYHSDSLSIIPRQYFYISILLPYSIISCLHAPLYLSIYKHLILLNNQPSKHFLSLTLLSLSLSLLSFLFSNPIFVSFCPLILSQGHKTFMRHVDSGQTTMSLVRY